MMRAANLSATIRTNIVITKRSGFVTFRRKHLCVVRIESAIIKEYKFYTERERSNHAADHNTAHYYPKAKPDESNLGFGVHTGSLLTAITMKKGWHVTPRIVPYQQRFSWIRQPWFCTCHGVLRGMKASHAGRQRFSCSVRTGTQSVCGTPMPSYVPAAAAG